MLSTAKIGYFSGMTMITNKHALFAHCNQTSPASGLDWNLSICAIWSLTVTNTIRKHPTLTTLLETGQWWESWQFKQQVKEGRISSNWFKL